MNENLNNLLNIADFKRDFLSEIHDLQSNLAAANPLFPSQKDRENAINIDDLTVVSPEEKIEKVLSDFERNEEQITEYFLKIPSETKKEEISLAFKSNLNLVKDARSNLENIRKEPLNLAFLLKDVEINKNPEKEPFLEKVNLRSMEIKRKYADFKFKSQYSNALENPKVFSNARLNSRKNEEKIENLPLNLKLTSNELLVHVSVYHGIFGTLQQEIVLFERQSLCELADSINCLIKELQGFENNNSGSFFFIENTFYNDTRKPENRSLSRGIVLNQKRSIKMPLESEKAENEGFFSEAKMEDCKFIDLKLKIGKVYLYRHHDSCDHMIVFNDLRFLNKSDLLCKLSYPYTLFLAKTKRKKCTVCQTFFAKRKARIICFNDQISDKNFLFFCENCYKNIHYDPNGTLKYRDFQIYPYIHE